MNNKMGYLVHYGTPRHSGRYPWGSGAKPYQNERTSLKKGSIRSTVSIDKKLYKKTNKNNKPLYTYNPNDEWDSKVYEGLFSRYISSYRDPGKDKKVYSHEYKVKKDVNLATKEQSKKVFSNLLKDKEFEESTKTAIETIRNRFPPLEYLKYYKKEYPNDTSIDRLIKLQKIDLSKKIDTDDGFEVFQFALEKPERYRAAKEYINKMASKYDAMIDYNNFDVYNKAKDPVIIFKTNEILEYSGSKKISEIKIKENVKYVEDVLLSAGMMSKN